MKTRPRSGRPAIRLGISRCLLGDPVRYDGGHKRDRYLVEVLGKRVEWVPVCPEVEAGLGVPRPPMRLAGPAGAPRLLTIATGADHTGTLERFSRRRVRELDSCNLSGYVFKQRSPSCGVRQVPIYGTGGVSRKGVGLFARAFTKWFPLVPVEDEERLADPAIRDHFIERVFGYVRWRELTRTRVTPGALAAFHERHRYVLLAHSRPHYDRLGRLLGRIAQDRTGRSPQPGRIVRAYGKVFMEALAVRATAGKHVRVLRDISRHVGGRPGLDEGCQLNRAIAEYRRGLVPLAVPLAAIGQQVRRCRLHDPALQTYLDGPEGRTLPGDFPRGARRTKPSRK